MTSFASKPFLMDMIWYDISKGLPAGRTQPCLSAWRNPPKGKAVAGWSPPRWENKHHLTAGKNIQIWRPLFQIGGGPHHGGGGGGQLFVGSRSLHQVCRLWSCLWTNCSHSHQEIQVSLLQKTLIYCSRSIIMIQPGCLDLWFKFVTFFAIQTNPLFFYEDIDI